MDDDLLTQSAQDFVAGLRPKPPASTLFVGEDVMGQLPPEMASRVPLGISTGNYGREVLDALHAAGQRALMQRQAEAAKIAQAEQTRMRELATRAATLDQTSKMVRSIGLPPAVEAAMLKDSMKTIMEPEAPGGIDVFDIPGGGKVLKVTQPGGRFTVRPMPTQFSPPGMVTREGIPGMEQEDIGTGRVVRTNITRPGETPEESSERSRKEWQFREAQTAKRRQIEAEIRLIQKAMAEPAPSAPSWYTTERKRKLFEEYQALPQRLSDLRRQLDAVLSGQPEAGPAAAPPEPPLAPAVSPVAPHAPVQTNAHPVMKWVLDKKTGKYVPANASNP